MNHLISRTFFQLRFCFPILQISRHRHYYLGVAFPAAHARMDFLVTPAFALAMTAKTASPSTPPERSPKRRAHVPRRRRSPVPHSALTQKYRSTASEEEKELIGKACAQEARHFAASSRFPASWEETVDQLTNAVASAALDGHERIRVDARNPEYVASVRAKEAADAILKAGVATHARGKGHERVALLMDACNSTMRTLLRLRDKLPVLDVIRDTSGRRIDARASLFFNSPGDQQIGASLLAPDLIEHVDMHVLRHGVELNAASNEISVVLCPNNTQSNPVQIELVELVHYSNWNRQNVVVLINPSLIALTRHSSLDDEPRPPSFMSDYVPCYYIDPVVYIAKNATGAMLRCFPRKWELYMLKASCGEDGFRLVGEQTSRPSREKLKCEFSWRVDDSAQLLVQ